MSRASESWKQKQNTALLFLQKADYRNMVFTNDTEEKENYRRAFCQIAAQL
jgi:hypothetical protein